MSEQWEKIMEHELDFYFNIQEYEDRLMERYYESQVIHYPVTVFDEEQGRVYLAGRDTEDQAIYRMEVKESIIALLRRAVKRINRLNNAISQLSEEEQDLISIFYLERDLSELHMARSLGYSTRKEFLEKKDKALKRLYAIYEKERIKVVQEFNKSLKDEIRRKADLFNKYPNKPMIQVG